MTINKMIMMKTTLPRTPPTSAGFTRWRLSDSPKDYINFFSRKDLPFVVVKTELTWPLVKKLEVRATVVSGPEVTS